MISLTTPTEWESFLKQYAAASQTTDWPGHAPATEAQLAAAEQKLKIPLPPSYRAFLAATNGWQKASRAVPVLRPIQKNKWFKREHADWVQAYADPMGGTDQLLPAETDYFNYTGESRGEFDITHLGQALCISEISDDAVLLLNPMVIWPDGEWEAWLFANWLPGALRYRSFAHWFQVELAKLKQDTFVLPNASGELPTVYKDGPGKPDRRIRPREKILTYDEALKLLKSTSRGKREKAVHHIARNGSAEAIAKLIDLLKHDSEWYVRVEAAKMLGKLQVQEAIDPLIALSQEPIHASSNAVAVLGDFNDDKSAQFLLKVVEQNGHSAGVAGHALARRNDPRPIPFIVRELLTLDPNNPHRGGIAGRYLANFQEPGLVALEPLMNHPDREIRRRATVGMHDLANFAKDKNVKIRAGDILEARYKCETDPDLQRTLKIYLEMLKRIESSPEKNPFV